MIDTVAGPWVATLVGVIHTGLNSGDHAKHAPDGHDTRGFGWPLSFCPAFEKALTDSWRTLPLLSHTRLGGNEGQLKNDVISERVSDTLLLETNAGPDGLR
jgi:hypothetical protein